MAAAPERNYWLAAAVILAIILYGSLYPFELVTRPGGAVETFLASITDAPSSRGDILANIALYAPLGLFLGLALHRSCGVGGAILVATLLALALSVTMELAQFHIADRVTSVYDALNNTLGGLIGAVFGVALEEIELPLLRDLARDKKAAIVLAAFFGYRLFPYAPTIDMHKYWHAVRALLEHPVPGAIATLRQGAMWLLIAGLTETLFGRRRVPLIFPLLFAAEIAGKIFILENQLAASDIAGFVLALLLWLAALGWMPGRIAILAFLFGLLVVADRLAPYQFMLVPHEFGWVPFLSLITGSPAANLVAFLEKVFQYGGLIWLLTRCRLSLSFATLFVAAILLCTSLAEIYLPGRSASLTDAAMALVIGLLFGLLGSRGPTVRAGHIKH